MRHAGTAMSGAGPWYGSKRLLVTGSGGSVTSDGDIDDEIQQTFDGFLTNVCGFQYAVSMDCEGAQQEVSAPSLSLRTSGFVRPWFAMCGAFCAVMKRSTGASYHVPSVSSNNASATYWL